MVGQHRLGRRRASPPPGRAVIRRKSTLDTYFLHDVPAEVLASGEASGRPEADIAFGQPCAIDLWPDVPTRVISGRDDRLFPLEFECLVARDRLGLEAGPGPRRPPPPPCPTQPNWPAS